MSNHAISVPAADSAFEEQAYAKVFRRVVPLIIVCYIVAYLDRINVGFAKLQMEIDLGFSQTVYGLGAGMFFIGYFFFEVPSNLIMYRVGARLWIARIMITWGLLSMCFVFVKTPFWFYTLRFLLGAAEAGFYPGVILYLTYWYPDRRRAAIVATFMAAIPIAGIFGNLLSGWIMDGFDQVAGMRGWQWMFIIEAIPAVILGIVVMFYLYNGIREATWLTEDEKLLLERNIEAEASTKKKNLTRLALSLRTPACG
jgi:Sugar phosphate permease